MWSRRQSITTDYGQDLIAFMYVSYAANAFTAGPWFMKTDQHKKVWDIMLHDQRIYRQVNPKVLTAKILMFWIWIVCSNIGMRILHWSAMFVVLHLQGTCASRCQDEQICNMVDRTFRDIGLILEDVKVSRHVEINAYAQSDYYIAHPFLCQVIYFFLFADNHY